MNISHNKLNAACMSRWKLSDFLVMFCGARVPQKASKGREVGLVCPWHTSSSNERGENLKVNNEKAVFRCFSCGKKGSFVDAIMFSMHKTQGQAIGWLCRELGIDDGKSAGPLSNAEILSRYAEACHRTLVERKDSQPYRDYLKSRGFDEMTINAFRIGCSDSTMRGPGIQSLLRGGLTEADLLRAGVIKKSRKGNYYPAFFKRVVMMNGKSMYGRSIRPKSEETVPHLYSSGKNDLFNKASITEEMDAIFVVESIFDALTVDQYIRATRMNWGVIAMLGTHGVSDEETAQFLASQKPKEVIVIPDNDPWVKSKNDGDWVVAAPGQKAGIHRAEVFANSGLNVRLMKLPDSPKGVDANDFGQAHVPPKKFVEYVNKSVSPLLYRMWCSAHYFDLSQEGGRQGFLNTVKAELRSDPGIPQEVIGFLHTVTGLSIENLQEELRSTMSLALARKAVTSLLAKGLTPEQVISTICQ